MRVTVAFLIAIAATTIALAVALSGAPHTLARTNGAATPDDIGPSTSADVKICQRHELVPSGTSAVRVSLGAVMGPRVAVTVLDGSQVVASGRHAPGWVGKSLMIPLSRVARTVPSATVCFGLSDIMEPVPLGGQPVAEGRAAFLSTGEALSGRMRLEYLRPGSHSWWSMLTAVARHLGAGHFASGSGIALLLLALMAGVTGFSSWIVLRDLR